MIRLFLSLAIIVGVKLVNAAHASDTSDVYRLLKQAANLQRINIDSCQLLAKQALELSDSIQYTNGISGAYNQLASVMMIRGRDDSALYYCNQSLLVSEVSGDYKRTTYSYVLMGYIYQNKGDKDSSLYAIYRALHYSQISNDSLGIAMVYATLGNFYEEYKEYTKSLFYYKKSYLLNIKIKNFSNASDALLGIANVYYLTEKYRTALAYYLQVDSLGRILNEPTGVAQNQNNIALCYVELNNKKQALYYYGLALNGYKKYGMRFEEANTYYNIGEMYLHFKQPDSAIYFGNKSLLIARELEDLPKVSNCYQLLAKAYSATGDYAKAYKYQEQFISLNDSLLNIEKVRSISEMETKYETEKKEQQIVLLDEQGKTKTAQRNFFIAGSMVLLLSVFVLGFYYLQRNKLAKKNAHIAAQQIETLLNETEIKTYNAMIEGQEEERQRIAGDLHDRLGSMLATIKVLVDGLGAHISSTGNGDKKQYDTAHQLIDEACSEVRKIAHNMSSSMLTSFGLVPALQELCDSIDQSGLIRCKLQAYGMDKRPDQQVELGCYRMVQELVSNILKHAKARTVTIQLNYAADTLTITIEDDGVGFDTSVKSKSKGMGMQNIAQRAKQLNGTFHIDSFIGRGTTSVIEIPTSMQEA